MKKILTTMFLLVAFAGVANAAEEKEKHPYTEINAEELQKLQSSNKDLVVVDSRGREYITGNIIKGAKVLPVSEMTEENLGAIASDKSGKIAFYCQNPQCPASALAAYKAAGWGYKNILKYPGGIEDWEKKSLPVEAAPKE